MRPLLSLFVLLAPLQLVFASNAEVTVLCYHTFIGKKSIATDFSAAEFKAQMQELKDAGFRFVSFTDILSNRVEGNKNILITIDDGNRTVKNIYGTCESLGITPVLFIYPAITGRVFYSLTFDEIADFHRRGAEIGGHGYYHLYINEKLYKSDPAGFLKEIRKPKLILEKQFSQPVTWFAYPFGSFSPITIQTLKANGYQYAFSLREDTMKIPFELTNNPYTLPRYLMNRGNARSILERIKKGTISRGKASHAVR